MYHTSTSSGCIAATALVVLGIARAADTPQTAPAAAPPRKSLDLKPPDIKKILTPEQITRLISATVDPDIEGVEVEGARENVIKEAAPLWRTAPSWLLPRETSTERHDKPDATYPHYRPPAAPPPAMAGEERPYDR